MQAGMSVIYHAIECGNEAILKLLIEKGADVNRCDEVRRFRRSLITLDFMK